MAEFVDQYAKQQAVIATVGPMFADLQQWYPVWSKLSDAKKLEWIRDNKSPLLSASVGVFIALLPFFESLK